MQVDGMKVRMRQDGKAVEKIVQFVDVGAAGQLMQDEKEMAEALQ